MDNVIVHEKRDRPFWIVWFLAFMLFIIPFFWFSPGEADLGGDGTRLFFYDSWSYIKNYSLSAITPSGKANEIIGYQTLPFVFLIGIIHYVISSPTHLTALIHGFTLSLSFFTIYCILITLMRPSVYGMISHFGAIAGGILYAFSPNLITRWDRMLMSQTDIFVFPLVYYLLLKFFQRNLFRYVIVAFIVTVIFSQNFSYIGAPGFFSFFPMAFISLLGYKKYVLFEKISWKKIGVGLLLFLGLHAYHMLPTILTTFTKNSQLNLTVFSKAQSLGWGLQYFSGIAKDVKVSYGFLLLTQLLVPNLFQKLLLIIPCVIFLGGFILASNKFASSKEKRLYLLYSCFFIITLFFATANITHTGAAFYASLFQIPGFSMFRAFFEQWSISQAFYTTILFGISGIIFAHYVPVKRDVYPWAAASFIFCILLLSFPFLLGNNVRQTLWKSSDVPVGIRVPSDFDLAVRSTTPFGTRAKFITFPLTDHGWQMVLDANGHGYMGPSFLSFVAGVQDFSSLGEMGFASGPIAHALRYRDYEMVNRMLGLLNIRYIFINNDERVFTLFPSFPYEEIKKIVGHSRADYETLLAGLHAVKQADYGQYSIYQLPDQYFFPRVFATSMVSIFDSSISDVLIPLTIGSAVKKPYIFAENVRTLPLATNFFIEATNSGDGLIDIEKGALTAQLSYSYARIRPGSVFYPFVEIYELFQDRSRKCQRQKLQCMLLRASKRLYEYETWGSLANVLGNLDAKSIRTQTNKNIWDLLKSSGHFSFENMILRYRDSMIIAIDASKMEKSDTQIKHLFLIHEFLLQHQVRMFSIINRLAYPDDTKAYLSRMSDETFDHLHELLNLPDVVPNAVSYKAGIDNFLRDTNTQYMATSNPKLSLEVYPNSYNNLMYNTLSLLYKGKTYDVQKLHESQSFPFIDSGNNNGDNTHVQLNVNIYDNLLKTAEIRSNKTAIETTSTGSSVFAFENSPEGISWHISTIERMGGYLILSFRYVSDNVPFTIKMKTAQTFPDKTSSSRVFINDVLTSGTWRTYTRVVKLEDHDQTLDLIISPDGLSKYSTLQVRNLTLSHVSIPKIYIKYEFPLHEYSLPIITYSKERPDTYTAVVQNAVNPYYVVLNQEYSPRWQLFKKDSITGKKISVAVNSHYRVNGNVNAWYIDPKEVSENEYTLILENTVRNYFLVGAFISITVFAGLIVYSVVYRTRKNTHYV